MTPSAIITQSVFNSLVIVALYISYQPNMILQPVGMLLDRFFFGTWLAKPLYTCIICMSSIYSIAIWILRGHWPSVSLLWVILVTAGITTLISPLVQRSINNHLDKVL
jgi:hypothetical protein